MSLVAELRQRKVFRVAAAYAVVAWLLIEVASVVLPALRLPEWTVTFVTILLVLGFPVALVLAWSFEVVRDRGTREPATVAADARCIAVLPFANMTEDAAQAHFADGLVEDLLTRLQAIRELKVVSRQSAFAYKGRAVDTRTIARELGSRYLVEGSVRRIGDRMRVTAQLIDAQTDQHVWAERYDRQATDAFALQDEICDHVVAAIQAQIAPAPGESDAGDAQTPVATAPSPPAPRRSALRILGQWWIWPVLAALVAMAALLTWTMQQRDRERWAREEAMPQLQALIDQDDYAAAFELSQRIAHVVPNDPQLRALEAMHSAPVTLDSDPAGAEVYFKPYDAPESAWRSLGRTPLVGVPVPKGVGTWRFELPGHATVVRTFRNVSAELQSDPGAAEGFDGADFTVPLPEATAVPDGMVFVPARHLEVALVSGGQPAEVEAFHIDRHEVTNREFKEFVDAGGYREAAYWSGLPFGDAVESWQGAVARFVDSTGRPGPATWETGTFADGTENHPVSGVSWFEAMAYARFRGKELPTAFHWYRAAYSLNEFMDSLSSAIVRYSNYAGKGTAAVGHYGGVGPYGTYDMAGNVREWLWTAMGEHRMVAGGAWNEPPYLYNQLNSADPWDRSPGNGLRLMRTAAGRPIPEALRQPVAAQRIDFAALRPVDDATYALLEEQLRYSATDLDARVENLPSTNPAWTRVRISLATGYDESRLVVHLFLPTRGRPPYQTIFYMPHSGHFRYAQSSDEFDPGEGSAPLDFIVKSGRAFAVVVFDGSFERRWPESRIASTAYIDRYRLRQRNHRQDLGRAIDYLATRADIDADRLGWLGISYGSQTMLPLLAVERRIGAAVLVGGGVFPLRVPAAEQPYNYLPRITQPVLMLSGRWDIDVSLEAQDAMLRMLGTPPDRKQRILFDVGHGYLPQNQFVRATLDWFDQHLGPTG